MLPLELYIHTLRLLPVFRSSDESVSTIVSCLNVNWLLRTAAMQSSVWEAHYKARYTVEDRLHGLRREQDFGEDYKSLYAARRKLDCLALKALNNIILDPYSPTYTMDIGKLLTESGYDIWDALQIEAENNLPLIMAEPKKWLKQHAEEKDKLEKRRPNLTRRFWALEILGILTRCEALDNWASLKVGNPNISLEHTIAGLSAFWGVPCSQIIEQLELLFHRCVEFLAENKIKWEASSSDYDIPNLCTAICSFMREEEFNAVENEHFHSLYNHFPHHFLTTRRKSIPLSLVFVFVALARRLGLKASPINTPRRVLARIKAQNEGESDTFVDVFNSASRPIVSFEQDVTQLLLAAGVDPALESPSTSQARPDAILIRASYNIFASLRIGSPSKFSDYDEWTCQYAATCAVALLTDDIRSLESIYYVIVEMHPLDLAIVVRDKMALNFDSQTGFQLKQSSEDILSDIRIKNRRIKESKVTFNQRSKDVPIQYFIGQIFVHCKYGYIGCIIGWTPHCDASEEWIVQMRVDDLSRGRWQPFYSVLDMTGRRKLVAEENIRPFITMPNSPETLFKKFVEQNPICGKYFSDAEFNISETENNIKGRFKMNESLRLAFPDDDHYGSEWFSTIEKETGRRETNVI